MDVLSSLWSLGSATAREVVVELEQRFEYDFAVTTILTVLQTLVRKGWAGRFREGHGHRYHPLLSKDRVQSEALRRLQYSVFDGSLARMRRLLEDPRFKHEPPAMTHQAYDAIQEVGLLYDSVPLYAARGDIAFYGEEAARARGPVLELGCGTGRILLPIARAGIDITGLEPSRPMLERLRAKPGAERLTVHEGDARHFALGRTFALITLPFRVLQHIQSVDDQFRLLDSVSRHLAPGGRFIFDVFNPRFSALTADRSAESEDTPELTLPDGRRFRRTASVKRVRWVDQISEVELVYYVDSERYVQAFDMRWYLKTELEHLLARAGFTVDALYGDFDRSALTDGAPEMIWVTSRT